MPRFDQVSKAWAAAHLESLELLKGREIKSLSFEYDHYCCWGHGEDDYCECDTSITIEVLVYFTNKSHQKFYPCGYDIGDIIKELVEWT